MENTEITRQDIDDFFHRLETCCDECRGGNSNQCIKLRPLEKIDPVPLEKLGEYIVWKRG